jgi:hypothetical protein
MDYVACIFCECNMACRLGRAYFVLVLVLVLEKHGVVDAMSKRPAPGGEPLWHIASGPTRYCFSAKSEQEMSHQAAPGHNPGR